MFTLTQTAVYETEIKKSRFIAWAANATNPEEAFAFLAHIRKARANHHCWAYKIGPKYRFSDDGEPGGTAGKPILNAIERQSVDHVMLVVIRYFGGVKLGSGGLVRAYGGCAAKCLQTAILKQIVVTTEIKLKVGFDDIGSIYPIIDHFGAVKVSQNYSQDGLEIRLKIKQADYHALSTRLNDVSAGKVEWID